MATKKTRYGLKENRIPIGKKKASIKLANEKFKNDDCADECIVKKKVTKSNKKSANSEPLQTININLEPTNTSLVIKKEIPKSKLSTITEIEENTAKNNETKLKKKLIHNNVKKNQSTLSIENKESIEESTKLIRNVIDDLDNTVNDMKHTVSETPVVLSPYVCTTRGQKWRPSPRKPPKLSELFDKYEDNSVADVYRKKLDDKTVELQQKAKFWAEISSDNNSIPIDFKDEIDVVCGQTKLLTTDKFMQMRSLIEEFDNKSGSMPIKTADLDGFWDMLLLQVEKLENQFKELSMMKKNNWVPLQPVVKKVINKTEKTVKVSQVKSKLTEFLKNQRIKAKPMTTNNENNNPTDSSNSSHFHEMKSSNNTCLISSTPTSINQKNVSFTPMLLKTMELSYVARRSGMTPIVLADQHVSPLKPALKKSAKEKGVKRKNIHFESPKATSDDFVTPQNSYNCDNVKHVQERIATPHNKRNSNNKPNKTSSETNVRRSSRLASKPSKNYKM
ncbi:guanylate kinase-associated protein mars [Adelges cooleyi]|uniref:guanylate kinase-associated protein mars n=1 Tax=Adelges cooleyi TaxID=133065 RepID=UPI0021801266|nr:guanylate kinase-associated protein mars [Adelges cooleyi]